MLEGGRAMRAICLALVGCVAGCGGGSVEGVPGAGGGSGTGGGTGMDAASGMDGPPPGPGASVAGCNVFPADNPWNTNVSALPLHPNAVQILAAMNPTRALHPDWGNWSTDHYGIPWSAGSGAPPLPVMWTASWGPTESDPSPCPSGGRMFC